MSKKKKIRKLKRLIRELEEKNQRISDDIHALVMEPESYDAHCARIRHELVFRMADNVLRATSIRDNPDGWGIIAQMEWVPKDQADG